MPEGLILPTIGRGLFPNHWLDHHSKRISWTKMKFVSWILRPLPPSSPRKNMTMLSYKQERHFQVIQMTSEEGTSSLSWMHRDKLAWEIEMSQSWKVERQGTKPPLASLKLTQLPKITSRMFQIPKGRKLLEIWPGRGFFQLGGWNCED